MTENATVLVPFDRGSAMPWDINRVAQRYGEVVFVGESRSPHLPALLPLLRETGETLVVDDPSEAVAKLNGRSVRGVVTFSDSTLPLAAALGEAFGCRFHSPEVADALTDKLRQRELLRLAGLPVPALRTPDSASVLVAAAEEIGFPCVVKPRRSCESRHTYRPTNVAAVEKLATDLAAVWSEVGGFLVEELLQGDPSVAGDGWGDYVSVESIVVDGQIHHAAVVGKFPLVEPFRESGHFFPSTLSTPDIRVAFEVAGQAIAALGIAHGTCHTELKLTREGPRVIEVNGRLGGFVGWVIEQASEVSLLELTVAAAVGANDTLSPALDRIGLATGLNYGVYCFAAADPHGRLDVGQVRGLDEVRRLPGVAAVFPAARRGDRIDPSLGSASCVCHVYGSATDHGELARLFQQINSAVSVSFVGAVPR